MIEKGKQAKVLFYSFQTWNVWMDGLFTVEETSSVVSTGWMIDDWLIVVSRGSTLITVVGGFARVAGPEAFSVIWDS